MRRERLHNEIRKRKLTYEQVGEEVGVSKGMISHIVNCRHNPGWEVQQRLVKLFGVPVEVLFKKNR